MSLSPVPSYRMQIVSREGRPAPRSDAPFTWVWGASDLLGAGGGAGGWHLVQDGTDWQRHVQQVALTANQIVAARSHMCAYMRTVDPLYRPMWASDLACHKITMLTRHMRGLRGPGTLGALLMRAPPQHFKTYLACENGPSFAAMQMPTARMIAMCYSRSLAARNIRSFSQIVARPVYQQLSRVRVGRAIALDESGEETIVRDEAKSAMVRYLIDGGGGQVWPGPGYYLSVSPGSELTGHGYEWGGIDDAVRGPDDAYNPFARTKLLGRVKSMFFTRRQTNSVMLATMTPWHPADIGYSVESLCHEAEITTEVLALPAVAEPGIPLDPNDPREPGSYEILDSVRHTVGFYREQMVLMGEYWAPLAQLQPRVAGQELAPESAWSTFQPVWLQTGKAIRTHVILSVDPNGDGEGRATRAGGDGVEVAKKKSHAHMSLLICVMMDVTISGVQVTRKMIFKCEQKGGPWPYGVFRKTFLDMVKRVRMITDIVIERKALGPALIADLAADAPNIRAAGCRSFEVHGISPTEDKGLRNAACVPSILSGDFCLPACDSYPDRAIRLAEEAAGKQDVYCDTDWVPFHKKAWSEYPNSLPGASDLCDADSQALRLALARGWVDSPRYGIAPEGE